MCVSGGGGERGMEGKSDLTFMTSSLSSSHLTNTEEEEERGREVARADTSCASLLPREAPYTAAVLCWRRPS